MMPAGFDLLLVDAHLATMRGDGVPYGAVREGAVGINDGVIGWVGRATDIPHGVVARPVRRAGCGGAHVARDRTNGR